MISEKAELQGFAVRLLRSHLEGRHPAHTYLFTGDAESGKEDLAFAFAAALNCEKGRAFEDCDCTSCRKIENHLHPDVRRLGAGRIGAGTLRDSSRISNDGGAGRIGAGTKSRAIKIEEAREAIASASLKPYEGKWKVFILEDADRLTPEASNALLKTLEEPPAHTIFILLVEHKANLPDTVRSRSFEVRLRPVRGAEPAPNPLAPEILEALRGKSWDDFFQEYAGKSREDFKQALDFLMEYFREMIRSHAEGRGVWQSAPAGRTPQQCLRAIDFLLETKDALDANCNQKLALSRLGMQLENLKT